jgi:ribose-phosphate pyrophosphokinase
MRIEEQNIRIFSGSASLRFTKEVCDYLSVLPSRSEVLHFSEGNSFVRILENVRGQDIYLVQSIAFPSNDNFVELLFWIDAFNRASAKSVTVLMPFFSYAKGDKKDEPRVSIRARVCADAIEAIGVDRIVTMDLHAAQIQGFFRKPVDDLYAMPIFIDVLKKLELKDVVIVSPDPGFTKKARMFADLLHASVAIGLKERIGHDENARSLDVIGNVEGKNAVIVDDVIFSGGTLVNLARSLVDKGALSVNAMVTHGAISQKTLDKLSGSPIETLYITNTIETQPVTLPPNVQVVSVAPLFGEAISRIANNASISSLFDWHPN